VARVGANHVRVRVGDHGRPAELSGQPVAERAEDRRVLPPRARRRRPGGDPLRLPEQVRASNPAGTGAAITAASMSSSAIVQSMSSSSSTGSAGARESCCSLTDRAYS